MLNCPWPLVTTERVRSIRTSLDASTVTPGSTAPDASRTTPAMALCALAADGSSASHTRLAAAVEATLRRVIPGLLACWTRPPNKLATAGIEPMAGRRTRQSAVEADLGGCDAVDPGQVRRGGEAARGEA